MKTLQRVLITIVWLSFLAVPWALLSYVCYAGLCGGGVNHIIRLKYGTFYGYFGLIYPVVLIISLIGYYSLRKKIRHAIFILYIPIICLLALAYVEFKRMQIENQYQRQVDEYYSAHADDYVCAPGRFIRKNGNQYYYFEVKGTGRVVNNYGDNLRLIATLKARGIEISQCKNKAGEAVLAK